jgi:DNA-binding XRE family transcriptional regulator
MAGYFMDSEALKRLEAAGWHSGTVAELFGLTPEESELIELRLALSKRIKQLRLEKNLTQKALGKQIGTSQSRVAKIEAGDPSVSMDLMFRCGFALGSNRRDLLLAISV